MGKVINLREIDEKQEGYIKFLNNFPTCNPGSLTISLLCVLLLVIATFTIVPVGIYSPEILSEPEKYFSSINNVLLTLYSHLYSPQIPVAVFAGALLGPRLGTFSMVLYILLGLLGFPVFCNGAGLAYIYEPTFGFIIGFVFSAYCVGKIFDNKIKSLNIIFAVIIGVLIAHFTGIFYMVANLYLNHYSIDAIRNWVWNLSLVNMPYDFIFGLILCSLARPIRGILWLAMN